MDLTSANTLPKSLPSKLLAKIKFPISKPDTAQEAAAVQVGFKFLGHKLNSSLQYLLTRISQMSCLTSAWNLRQPFENK